MLIINNKEDHEEDDDDDDINTVLGLRELLSNNFLRFCIDDPAGSKEGERERSACVSKWGVEG